MPSRGMLLFRTPLSFPQSIRKWPEARASKRGGTRTEKRGSLKVRDRNNGLGERRRMLSGMTVSVEQRRKGTTKSLPTKPEKLVFRRKVVDKL